MKENLQLILGALSLIGIGLAIGAILVFVFMSPGGLVPEKISVGPVDFIVPTSQPFTPVVQPSIPTSTTEPQGPSIQSLGTIRVFGNSNAGVQIEIPETGIYRFSYRSGAYSTYAIGNSPEGAKTWLTAVFIYRGNQALWDGRRIKDESLFLRLADMKYWDSAESAENAAKGQYVEAQLAKGDVLTLIAVDHFDAYADNPGQVIIEWFYVRY
jgi:hypothetical protein